MSLVLEDRAVANSDDRPTWLLARRTGVTATEIAKIDRGGAAVEALVVEKRRGVQSFSGNRYTEYGKMREPHIARWVQENFDIAPSTVLYHAETNRQHLATPDGVGHDFLGRLILSEIKTSKKPFIEVPRDYLVQIWWQQYVLGAERTLIVWEQHDDDWPEPQPLHPQPEFRWVERDDTEIGALIAKADEFLARLDAEGLPEIEYDLAIDELAQDVLLHRELEVSEKKAKEAAWAALQDRLADRADYSQASASARVTRTVKTTTSSEPDLDAARAADPDLFQRFEAITTEYQAHLALHSKPATKTSASLTVTRPQKDSADA